MNLALIDQAIEFLEKANAELEPELLAAADARELMAAYARAERLAGYGMASLTRKIDNAAQVAQVTGTSIGKAKATVTTGTMMQSSDALGGALQQGDISLDQAAEIAGAEASAPGAAKELLKVAKAGSFHELRDKARATKLEAEQHRGLADRQRCARRGRSHNDELGMVHVHLAFEPHVGTPIVARAEADAARRARAAKRDGEIEPFERHLADAYAALLAGGGSGRVKRPELVVLVSHEVVKRGWTSVRPGELCKIPGVGPIAPETAKMIAGDAFLNGVVYDGTDLRHFKRWTKHIPVEVAIALELGQPPDFDGVRCVDCGNSFKTEFDHVRPRAAKGPTSNANLRPRCWSCHQTKTAEDRKNGRLRPAEP